MKDPIGTKGARLSTQISIAGRLLVYLPQDPHIGISQQIEDEDELRSSCASGCSELVPRRREGRLHPAHHRRRRATEDELRADIAYLRKLWARDPRALARARRPPALLYQDLSLAQRVLRDLVDRRHRSACVIDSRENFEKLHAFAASYMPQVRGKLEHYTGERPLFDLYNVDDEIEKALARRVDLKSGGYLIIDQTEALTTIDVNTGGFVGSAQLRRHDLQDQPRGGAGDRAPAAAAQPGRHHHRRLHRHGRARSTATRCWPSSSKRSARDRTRDDGQRLHRSSAWSR